MKNVYYTIAKNAIEFVLQAQKRTSNDTKTGITKQEITNIVMLYINSNNKHNKKMYQHCF